MVSAVAGEGRRDRGEAGSRGLRIAVYNIEQELDVVNQTELTLIAIRHALIEA